MLVYKLISQTSAVCNCLAFNLKCRLLVFLFFFLTLVSSLREMVGDKPGLFRISIFYLGLIEILLTKIDKSKDNYKVCSDCD